MVEIFILIFLFKTEIVVEQLTWSNKQRNNCHAIDYIKKNLKRKELHNLKRNAIVTLLTKQQYKFFKAIITFGKQCCDSNKQQRIFEDTRYNNGSLYYNQYVIVDIEKTGPFLCFDLSWFFLTLLYFLCWF